MEKKFAAGSFIICISTLCTHPRGSEQAEKKVLLGKNASLRIPSSVLCRVSAFLELPRCLSTVSFALLFHFRTGFDPASRTKFLKH